jgi:hypothetical protein
MSRGIILDITACCSNTPSAVKIHPNLTAPMMGLESSTFRRLDDSQHPILSSSHQGDSSTVEQKSSDNFFIAKISLSPIFNLLAQPLEWQEEKMLYSFC